MPPYAKQYALIAGGIAALGIFIFWRSEIEEKPTHYAALSGKRPDVTIDGFTLQCIDGESQDGWQLAAARGDVFQESGCVTCSNLTYRLLHNATEVGVLLAQRGEVDQSQQIAWLHGDVQGTYARLRLNGSEFRGDLRTKQVLSEKPVTITGQQFTCTAQHSALGLDEETILLSGGVTSEFN